MEIGIGKKHGMKMKAQLFSLTALIFILLMIITLFIFVIMNIGYDSLSEASIISTSSTNYGSLLSKSASSFAYSSGQAAMSTLFQYESNSIFRGTNFVSNTSQYLQYLIVNGTIPNVQQGSSDAKYISYLMGSATFVSYNSEISSITGASSKQIAITETKPLVFQSSPYAVNIKYIENVMINTSTGNYNFAIPVNVSVPINNTPDIFYAEQGIDQPIRFSNIKNTVTVIGNDYASSGTTNQVVYGVVVQVPAGAANCNAVPTGLRSAPYSNSIILVTSNAFGISSCANSYGGLITESVSSTPTTAYLIFPTSANVIPYLQTGQQVLLYGPGLAVLNISNFISSAYSGSYFTSPFATSYLDRASGNFSRQSPNGIFTFFEASRQAASFNGFAQISTTEPQSTVLGYTVAGWVRPSVVNGIIETDRGSGSGASLTLGMGTWCTTSSATVGDFFFGDDSSGVGIGVQTTSQYPANSWYFVVGTFNAVSGELINGPSPFTLYINGNAIPTTSWCNEGSNYAPLSGLGGVILGGASPTGGGSTGNVIGSMADFQIYNSVLTQSQIYYLYQEGIEGIPLSNSPLLGWYPLDGNANDYSGNGYSTTASRVTYGLLQNYQRDSIFVRPIPTNTYPVPGLLTCFTTQQCNSVGSTNVYIGDVPLSIGNGGLSTAYFNGQNSNIMISSIVPTSNVISVSAWINFQSLANVQYISQSGNFLLTYNSMGNKELDYWINMNGGLHTPVTTTYPMIAGQWYMITGTFGPDPVSPSNNCLTIYVNWVSVNSICSVTASYSFLSGGPIPLNSKQTYIGSNILAKYFNGTISNLQIYNTTLSASEVASLYQDGINGPPVDTRHIVGWWPLDGNANDYSGYGDSGNVLTSISYRLIQSNYSGYYTYNSIGLSTQGVVANEWQTIGFPAHP